MKNVIFYIRVTSDRLHTPVFHLSTKCISNYFQDFRGATAMKGKQIAFPSAFFCMSMLTAILLDVTIHFALKSSCQQVTVIFNSLFKLLYFCKK